MNIQRPYRLPNCTLTLEGMASGTDPSSSNEDLQIILNARCQFLGTNQSLEGGRAFLEALAKAVNSYAQGCLSGIPHPTETRGENGEWAELTPLPDQALHRLVWHPPADESSEAIAVDLSTVELFDLVEAVDQFIGDRHTLPDFSLTLEPLSRRHRQPDEPFVQRAIPASLGALGLAVFALVIYWLPIPEIREPEVNPGNTPDLIQPDNGNPTDGPTP
ncbi:DUF4335 domain-containing protein [Synechocystis sp. FACHB-383]|uniref:DUF4335 domain-containing protein n=1 Tax=Synechocystis sp. FACHB-383 TaxID=2692864 RepID=UPI0016855C8F|nr:DUF4335 domain-containing protein [Synechocystis sp. FACHB-383]MBD2653787.1 DUF4335 domain-containing protein [Synechocystis sp. FACHB-383]